MSSQFSAAGWFSQRDPWFCTDVSLGVLPVVNKGCLRVSEVIERVLYFQG